MWKVEWYEAYDEWIKRVRPKADVKAHLNAVVYGWQKTGPPKPVETYGNNSVCIGPHGERVTYRVYDAAPEDRIEGIIHVIVIG